MDEELFPEPKEVVTEVEMVEEAMVVDQVEARVVEEMVVD